MKMKYVLVIGILLASLMLSSGVSAAVFGNSANYGFSGSTNNFQSSQPSFDRLYSSRSGSGFVNAADMWPILRRMENDQCNATSDFIIGIPAGGCTPSVVRSDLLEEQNVPVFCQLYAIKVNPLIKVSSIRSISFPGPKPEGVSSIVFHPARAAVKSYTTLLGDPTLNNIGYVVIILKQEKIEDNMEEWIAGNLSATIRYDADEAYGTGASEYYLPRMNDDDWNTDYAASSFWSGRGYLRLESSDEGTARIQILSSKDRVIKTFNLKEGETSPLTYLPGYYCRAGLKIKLDGIVAPEDKVLVNVDGDEFWLREGDRFLNGKCRISKLVIDDNNEGNMSLNCNGNKRTVLGLSSSVKGDLTDEALGNKDAEKYFIKANQTTAELVEIYRSAEKGNGETYGEEALYEQIILSGRIGKFATQAVLMDLFIDKYFASKIVADVRNRRQRLNGTDFSKSYTSVYVNDKFHTIGVVDFRSVDEGDQSVDLRIGGTSYSDKKVGWSKTIGSGGNFSIQKIMPGKILISFDSKKKGESVKSEEISIGDEEIYNGVVVSVRDIVVDEVAHISIIPEVKHTTTEADFTFRIGIEKRAIELSPEKTIQMLKNLNESIDKWTDIVERLGNVVKGLKGACFATSTFLMLKNMATGFSGEAAARQRVMEKFKTICDAEHGTKTRTECYNELSNEIEGNVTAMTVALKKVNDKMSAAQVGNTGNSGGLFGGTAIDDQEEYRKALRGKIVGKNIGVNVGGTVVQVPVDKLSSVSQLQAVLLSQELDGKGVVGGGESQLDQSLRNTALMVQQEGITEDVKTKLNSIVISGVDVEVQSVLDLKADKLVFHRTKKSEIIQGGQWSQIGDDKYIEIVERGGTDYVIVLKKGIGGTMTTDVAYPIDSNKELGKGQTYGAVFIPTGAAGDCSYSWPSGRATVSYYEAGKNKGLPALIPFDLDEGWYAMVPNSGGTFLDDSPQGYTASADVKYFKICNIGPDRVMQNGQGDDLCQSFDANTIGSVKDFIPCPDKSADEVRKLYTCAREAIRQASAQAGKDPVSIKVCGKENIIKRGKPMSQVGGFECQDFMSADDCKLMFNVCDPVICPPSRCDLGGKVPVSDVIQTGIIGSLVLCLPNAAEGVLFPICLSGIHAGLDNYLSILRDEQKCLRASLETGEHIGICDAITSIYKCEFFWRQLSPVMDQLIPGIVQGLIAPGQRVRGGGEYALVQQSWNSMQQSVSYFRDVYAQNAFKAFNIRSTEEVGSEVCKAFIGTSVPGGADIIDSLLEPESPHQFYAQFSEQTFTEATVPATSQYKVYYHIYAGNDQGVQYRIYLKNPPQTGYYQSNPTVWVKSGYIAKGSSADEAIDFIAPEGYQELCVVVNAEEKCGFKQVTTDFGLEYIQRKYVQEQAENNEIKNERECISGTPSALSMVNLNLQAGLEETMNPEIAMRGIVRICASVNPAAGVDVEGDVECVVDSSESLCGRGYTCQGEYCEDAQRNRQKSGSRWKNVGTCGGGLTCWLDVNSVKDDLRVIEAVSGKSISLLDEQRGLIDTGVLDLEGVQKTLAGARLKIKGLGSADLKSPGKKIVDILAELDKVIGIDAINNLEGSPGAGTNSDRAEALALKASVYRMIVMELTKGLIVQPAHTAVSNEVSGESIDDERIKILKKTYPEYISEINELLDAGVFIDDIEDEMYDMFLIEGDDGDDGTSVQYTGWNIINNVIYYNDKPAGYILVSLEGRTLIRPTGPADLSIVGEIDYLGVIEIAKGAEDYPVEDALLVELEYYSYLGGILLRNGVGGSAIQGAQLGVEEDNVVEEDEITWDDLLDKGMVIGLADGGLVLFVGRSRVFIEGEYDEVNDEFTVREPKEEHYKVFKDGDGFRFEVIPSRSDVVSDVVSVSGGGEIVRGEGWSINNAIAYIDENYEEGSWKSSTKAYSDILIKRFVDELYEDGKITSGNYDGIRGYSDKPSMGIANFFNAEENIGWVRNMLVNRKDKIKYAYDDQEIFSSFIVRGTTEWKSINTLLLVDKYQSDQSGSVVIRANRDVILEVYSDNYNWFNDEINSELRRKLKDEFDFTINSGDIAIFRLDAGDSVWIGADLNPAFTFSPSDGKNIIIPDDLDDEIEISILEIPDN